MGNYIQLTAHLDPSASEHGVVVDVNSDSDWFIMCVCLLVQAYLENCVTCLREKDVCIHLYKNFSHFNESENKLDLPSLLACHLGA